MVVKGKFSKKPPPPVITLPKSTNPFITTIGALKSKPYLQEALELIYEIANLVGPIMKENGFKVKQLAEFYPKDNRLLGLNTNHGWKIQLRLRPHYNESAFLDKYEILGTMLHELTHNLFGPHDQRFYNKLNDLIARQEELMASGVNQLVFQGYGNILGGWNLHPDQVKQLRLQKLDKEFTGGVNTLGGSNPFNAQGQQVDIKALVRETALKRYRDTTPNEISCSQQVNKVEELKDDDDLEILDIRHSNEIKPHRIKLEKDTEHLKETAESNPTPQTKSTPSTSTSSRSSEPPKKSNVLIKPKESKVTKPRPNPNVLEQKDQKRADNADRLEKLLKAKSEISVPPPAANNATTTPKKTPPKRGRKTISEKVKAAVREQWEKVELPSIKRKNSTEVIELSDGEDDNGNSSGNEISRETKRRSNGDTSLGTNTNGITEIIDLTDD